jgi:hypothetical protein
MPRGSRDDEAQHADDQPPYARQSPVSSLSSSGPRGRMPTLSGSGGSWTGLADSAFFLGRCSWHGRGSMIRAARARTRRDGRCAAVLRGRMPAVRSRGTLGSPPGHRYRPARCQQRPVRRARATLRTATSRRDLCLARDVAPRRLHPSRRSCHWVARHAERGQGTHCSACPRAAAAVGGTRTCAGGASRKRWARRHCDVVSSTRGAQASRPLPRAETSARGPPAACREQSERTGRVGSPVARAEHSPWPRPGSQQRSSERPGGARVAADRKRPRARAARPLTSTTRAFSISSSQSTRMAGRRGSEGGRWGQRPAVWPDQDS